MPEGGGGKRRDDGTVRGARHNRDVEEPLFAVWDHGDMKARATARGGRWASDTRRSREEKRG